MRFRFFHLFLCLAAWSGSLLLAQTEGEITGQITDASGAVVGGAKVTITNEGTQAIRETTTDAAGIYDVPSLTPGLYSVTVAANGFRTEVRHSVELQVQQAARLNFQMQLGQVSEVVEVKGGAPLINTENATVGSVIENKRIVDLPLNGRNFLQLISLDANVSFGFGADSTAQGRLGGDRSNEDVSIAGGRAEFNHFTLDGMDNTDTSFNSYIFLPSIDAIQEFKVQTGVYPAEFGRGSSQINVSTKPGTNNYHGALFEFLRNSSVDASNYSFTAVHPPTSELKQNQFGFTLGGPISIPKVFNGKDKLFFMANYEGFRVAQGVTEVGSVPNATERTGDFSSFPSLIYDPTTRVQLPNGTITAQPFPGNTIPQNRIDPVALKLLNYYPLPNVPGAGLSNNYQTVPAQTTDNDQFTIRVDYIESDKSSWFGRYSYSNEVGVTPSTFPQLAQKLETFPKQALLSNIRTFSPSIVNEFRFGFNKFDNFNLNADANSFNGVGAVGGIPGAATPFPLIYGLPEVGITGFSSFGDNAVLPFIQQNNNFEWSDTLSWVRGKHSLRIGTDIRRDQFNTEGNSFERGNFIFTGFATQNPLSASNTGIPFADYLLGYANVADVALGLAETELRATAQSYFVDDTWKVAPNLTLTLGLRYDYFAPFHDKHDNIANILFPPAGSSAQPVFVRPGTGDFYANTPVPFVFGGGIQVERSNTAMGQSLTKPDKNNFAPRIGLAYSPTPKWTIRSAFGQFYVLDIADIAYDLGRNLAGRRQTSANTNFPNLTFEAPFTGGATLGVQQPFVLAQSYDMPTSYVLQYLLDVQRQITSNLILDVGYMGNEGHHLQTLIDLNVPQPGPGPVQARREWPEFGVIQTNEPWVNSNYNALSVRLQKRLSHGLTFVESYAWSRAIDDGSAIRDHNGDTLFPQNPADLEANRGLSNFQVEHRSVTSILWELPFGKNRQWLNGGGVKDAILGGWQLGTIVTAQSGSPFTIIDENDPANNGEPGYEFANYTGMSPNLPSGQQNPAHWFNTAAFALPPQYTYGNVGRNTEIGPGLVNVDLSLLKQFVVHEGQYFQLRFEAFNSLNHPNWGLPQYQFPSPSFGTISTTATAMRELQVALKFMF